jgi:hypothetical protein
VVRVEHQQAAFHRQAHQEVARKRHAFQRHAHAARQFHLDDAQADRNAEFAVQYVVEIAVARVVVVLLVAGESELVEEVTVDGRQPRLRVVDRLDAWAQLVFPVIALRFVGANVEVRILVARDHQRGAQQRDVFVAQRGNRVPGVFAAVHRVGPVPMPGEKMISSPRFAPILRAMPALSSSVYFAGAVLG